MTESGSCPCHPDIERAVAAHQHLVEHVARSLRIGRTESGYDDAISDGLLALWRALATYDPARGDLEPWLRARIRFRMIDGLRARTGRGPRPTFVTDDRAGDRPIDTALDTVDTTDELLAVAVGVDSRLPVILALLTAGWTRTEVGRQVGISRTRIWQLMTVLQDNLRQSRDIAS